MVLVLAMPRDEWALLRNPQTVRRRFMSIGKMDNKRNKKEKLA